MNTTKLSFFVFFLSLGLLSLSGCVKSDGEAGAEDGGEVKAAAAAPKVQAVRAHIMTPIERSVVDYEEFTGRIMAFDEVDVQAQVSGTLLKCLFKEQAQMKTDPQTGRPIAEAADAADAAETQTADLTLREGDEVKEGQLLFELDSDVYEAALASAKGELEVLEARKKRLENVKARAEKLRPSGAISDEDYDEALFELQECEAEIAIAKAEIQKAQINVDYTKIYAPIDGYLCDSEISIGNLVQANGTPLVRIVKVDPIFIFINIDEATVQRLKKIADERKAANPDAMIVPEIEFRLSDDDSFVHRARIDYMTPTLEQGSGTRFIRAVCKNPKTASGARLFQPGMTAHIRIRITEEYDAILVPEETLGTNQSTRFVYVLDEKNMPEMRTVEPGPLQEDNMRVIRKGLAKDERIVRDNLLRVRLDRPVDPIPEENAPASPVSEPSGDAMKGETK
ncbi:MAG: efflux RND transporter periplasmic adaptor subunit [Thermoguttaceae bacterium]|nr:efflux RND transporter periplasmic adaptor subunit [Thermoguttaceae bacterium]